MTDNYHDLSDKSISKTKLNLFLNSPLEYHLTYNTHELPPWQPTKPALIGTVGHAVLLEDKPLDELVVCYDESCFKVDGTLNGKRAAAFREEHPDAVVLKSADYEDIATCCDAILKHGQLREVLQAASDRERRFDATVCGLPSKCKPDILCDMGRYIIAYDLKFSEKIDPASFRRSAKRLRYWLQDAHYSAVLTEALGKPVQFRFWAIETRFPFRVQPYFYAAASRESAGTHHVAAMERLAECYRRNSWEDGWDSTLVLEPWDVAEEELVEVHYED